MTTDAQRLSAISAEIDKLLPAVTADMGQEVAAEVYRQFCALGALLSPAISKHLACHGLSEIPEAHPDNLPAVHWGQDTPDSLRRYNAHVIARLLYDLKPAIENAFPGPGDTVFDLLRDLKFEEAPVALPRLAKKPAGAGGRPNRDIRANARAKLYEIVIFESARRGLSITAVREELTNGVFTADNWKALRKEVADKIDTDKIAENGKNAGARHPDCYMLDGERRKNFVELIKS